jgi:hypothetical protein
MARFALADVHQPKFSTKISTGSVEIFDGFRDGNLTSEVANRSSGLQGCLRGTPSEPANVNFGDPPMRPSRRVRPLL